MISMWEPYLLAIGFLQPALLGWMAAAVVPVLIHLWSRRRHRETDWAAMEFLLAAYRPRRWRLLLQELLLLLARVALIVLLVGAAAEPVWRGLPAGVAATSPTHRVFVIDASLSMSAEEGGTTRFETAKAEVMRLLESAAPGDLFSLILAGRVPDPALAGPIFDRQAFREEIQRLQPTDGRVDWGQALARSRELISAAQQDLPRPVRAEVVLITDLQRASWPAAVGTTSSSAAALQREANLLSETARLVVVPVASGGWQENVAVADLQLESGAMTVGEEAAWRAVMRRYGPSRATDVAVQWFVDGKLVRESTLPWNGERRREAMLTYRFDSPGDHEIEVRIAPDALKGDDTRRFVLPVRPAVRVLCVDGRPSNVPFQGASDYLRLALQPGDEEGFRRVAVRTEGEGAFDDIDLTPFDAVFFCDVAEFTESEAARLAAFVNRGGGLAFFLGERVRAENYNRVLAAGQGGRRRLLPARLGPIIRRDSVALDPLGYRHPLLRAFQGRESVGLLTAPVSAYFRLEKTAASNAQSALALDNGDPLILTETIGFGRVILAATTADTTWTAFPIWADYVPMIQETLEYLLEPRREQRNVAVGDSIGEVRDLKRLSGSMDVEIVAPDGRRIRRAAVMEGEVLRWSFDDTQRAGFYRADLRPSNIVDGPTACAFAVNPPVEESDPDGWLPEEFSNRVLPGVPVEMRGDADRSQPPGEATAGYNRAAQWLLQLALVLLVLEMMLAVRSG
ncbi:BatA domain-containing protein [Thermopirellula anaerolimosa]